MAAFFGMPDNAELARDLAARLGLEADSIETRRFPDGESYVRVKGSVDQHAFLVCTLARPDDQFLPLIFAERAMRASGAKRVTLIAPYLAYLRQDRQFKSGEALASRIFADLVSQEFDALVTVDPHLHRYASLSEVYRIPVTVVDTAEVIGSWVRENVPAPAIVGPDSESAQWVEEVARFAGCPWMVFDKERHGDRDVDLKPPDLTSLKGLTPVLVDDIIASGATAIRAAKILVDAGLKRGFCVAIHALFNDQVSTDLGAMFEAVLTTDSIPNPLSRFEVAPLIAAGLAKGGLL